MTGTQFATKRIKHLWFASIKTVLQIHFYVIANKCVFVNWITINVIKQV
jgi:hypothetical protein